VATRTGLRVALGPVGIWASLDAIQIGEVLDFVSAVEDLAFGALWVNGSAGREPFAVPGALGQPNYRANLRRGGYTDEDLDAVSNPLVDAFVATEDEAALRARMAFLGEAGADHVAVIPLCRGTPSERRYGRLGGSGPPRVAGPGVANARPEL